MGDKKWDPWKMFDVTRDERALIEKRAKMRSVLKVEWQKKFQTPFHQSTGWGGSGYIFDPAVQRYISLRRTEWEYFKVLKKKPLAPLIFGVLGPVFLLTCVAYVERESLNKSIASGEITYKDRTYRYRS